MPETRVQAEERQFRRHGLSQQPENPFAPKGKGRLNPTQNDDNDEKVKEIKMNMPKDFSGKRGDLKKFLQDVYLYLHVNEKIYDTDTKKIAFALALMNEGDAASWKEQLLEEAMAVVPFSLGTWDMFLVNLSEAFAPYDAPGDALEEMKTLHMGTSPLKNILPNSKC